jgi:subfamily B ATP-binding cassette protein MsbA
MSKPKHNRVRLTDLLRPHGPALSLAFLAVLGEALTDLLEPWPLKIVLDSVIGSKNLPGWVANFVSTWLGTDKASILNFAVMAVILIAIGGAISSYLEKVLTTSVGQWVMHDLRTAVYHHMQRLSLSYHYHARTGDLISRVTGDIGAVQDFISSALLGIIVNVLTLVGMLAVMFYVNWGFTLIALLVAPALFLVVYSYTRRIKNASRDVRKKEGEVASVVQESLTSIQVIQAFAREDYEEKRFEQESLESVEAALRARSMKARLTPLVEIITAVGTCLVLWYGARLVLSGQMTAGSLLVFFLYLGKMYKPMRDLSKMTDTVSKTIVGYERIKEIMETDLDVKNLPGSRKAPPLKGRIEFNHVFFAYRPDQPVLRDLSMHIEPGQVAALVGPTGAGKSTIASLMARFYDPVSGQVRIDGRDVRGYKLKSLRQQISFVLQESLLFRAPIWQNIAYGRPGARRADIMRAAELANAHEFIARLPEGYNTMVGERGVTLSGGQRQRIAIARAIIRSTPILILDEPTSGLDSSSEELVVDALDRLMENKTSIVIAHRLTTIRKADVIFAIDRGRVVESGTHDELLARNGLYASLHQKQFRDEPEEAVV